MPLPFEIHQLRQLSLARGPCAQEKSRQAAPQKASGGRITRQAALDKWWPPIIIIIILIIISSSSSSIIIMINMIIVLMVNYSIDYSIRNEDPVPRRGHRLVRPQRRRRHEVRPGGQLPQAITSTRRVKPEQHTHKRAPVT